MHIMTIAAANPRLTRPDVLPDWQEPRWYVLFVRSNQERRVAHGLAQRGLEHLLPCYSAIHQWKDRRVRLELPMFPGYVFVRLPLLARMSALTIPNVVCLVGKKAAPSVGSDEEIAAIRISSLYGYAQPHPQLTEGDRVMITSGPLTGMQGIVLRTHNRARVVISVESISRAFVVEVDAGCVESVKKATSYREVAKAPTSTVLPGSSAVPLR